MSNMKVAFIDALLSKHPSLGIEKKFIGRARASAALGLDADFFYFGFGRRLRDDRICFYRRGGRFAVKLVSALSRYTCITKQIDTGKYDFLVIRYAGGDLSIFSDVFRKNQGKIVTEHHTKELPEAFTYQTTFPQKLLTLSMERFLGPKLFKGCGGLIGVTDEIRQYELQRAGTRMAACTIPNGVVVRDIPFSGRGTYNGRILNLLCLANTFEAWQGLDRVLAGVKQYKSRKPCLHLKVVGYVPPRSLNGTDGLNHDSNVRVDFLGKLYGAELEGVLGQAHVAFSSLALFRKGMKEACALKTREFAAQGLPFILDHQDPDFPDTEAFLLRVPSDNSPVDMDTVVTFAERILARKGLPEYMRAYAMERLDWKTKMRKTWDFLKSISTENV